MRKAFGRGSKREASANESQRGCGGSVTMESQAAKGKPWEEPSLLAWYPGKSGEKKQSQFDESE
jgi:hypothetical protein